MMSELEVVRREERQDGNFYIMKQPGLEKYVEIEDTFAEMCHHNEILRSVLEKLSPFC